MNAGPANGVPDDPPWRPRSLADGADLPVHATFLQAQPWCNFVLWEPAELPRGCSVRVGTLRYEAPPRRDDGHRKDRPLWTAANTSSYRLEVAGPGRSIRVKQFLYDWAFPALDQPSLWLSRTTPVPVDDRYVLWIGTDHRHLRGAALRRARTSVEFSVTSGSFADDELATMASSLREVSSSAASAIRRTPLAQLSYWARHPVEPVRVPIGLWRDTTTVDLVATTWSAGPLAWEAARSTGRVPGDLGGFHADTVIAHRGAGGRLALLELVYTGGPDRGHELRLLLHRSSAPLTPRLADHPGTHSTVHASGLPIHVAAVDERYGAWDAIWQDPVTGDVTRLLSTSGVRMDRGWFVGALTRCVREWNVRNRPYEAQH